MLTTNAFNALLKTLEEPPPHIIFIFATTELRQLPDTILGRCQVYHLRKLSLDQISERLQTILRVEGIEYDQPAVDLVCREGQGSMRDAITFLDQLIALGGGRLDYKKICEMIAYVPSSMCLEFVRYLLALDITSVLDLISQWDQRGVALTVVLDDIIRNVRDVSIVKEMDGKTAHPGLLGTESQGINTLQRIAETVSAYDLHALFRALVDCRSQLNGSSIDRYIVENYVMEWTLAKKDERFRIKDKASSISRDFETLGSDQIKVADNMQTSLASDGRQTLTIEENNVNAAARLVEQSSDTPSTSTTFPESWRILVEKWKRKKPVQGRMLEEAIPVEYSTAKIVLAVNPSGLAGKDLLNPDTQREIAEQFKIHFDFKGVLNIYPKESSGRENAGGITSTDDTESLLEIKKKEKEQFNQKTLEEATHHQVTQKALRQFKGKIESIEIKQDDN